MSAGLFDLTDKVAIVTGCNTGLGQGMAVALAQAAARQFMLQGGGGRIINIASLLSFQGGIRVPAYTASKWHGRVHVAAARTVPESCAPDRLCCAFRGSA